LFPFIVDNHSNILEYLINNYQPQIVIASAITQGRTLMPHLSVRLNTGLTADCTELQIEKDTDLLLQIRPAIGGNIMATIKTTEKKPQMTTVRPISKKHYPLFSNPKMSLEARVMLLVFYQIIYLLQAALFEPSHYRYFFWIFHRASQE
jgi:electron transfer flavoprotein alpha subunit